MLTAIRVSDNSKVIGNLIGRDSDAFYYCEYCKKNVIHNKSDSGIRIGHFKHKKGESHCPNQTGESEYHIRTKLDIYSHIKKHWHDKLKFIELEKWICDNTIRADIYIETSKNKLAIEIQATILTVDEIKKRTKKYAVNDVAVLWILPYEHKRMWEYKFQYFGYSDDGNNWDWSLSDNFKMKEMEIFLYWAYFKKLIFWDIEHKHSDSFICAGFTEYKSENVEFRRDGEEHFYHGKTAKTIKIAQWIKYNIEFNQLKVTYSNEFKSPFRDYIIPARKLLTYEKEQFKRNKYKA